MLKNIILPLAISAVVLNACNSSDQTNKQTDNSKIVPITQIIKKDTLLSVEYVADIQSVKNVEIHSRVSGILEKIFIKEGQVVKAGQPLFKINDSELQIQLSRAAAAYNSALAEAKVAKVELDRVQTLVERKVVQASEYDLVEAKYLASKAKAEQALAEKNAVAKQISYTVIKSPFNGVVDRIPLKEGSIINEMSLLTSISDNSSMNAYFNVSEKIYFDMMENGGEDEVEKVTLVLPNGSVYEHKGNIIPAESEINESTGSIAYKVVFPNPNNLLRHGASGKLILDQPIKEAMLIPQKSVVEIQDKYYVFIVDPQNKVKMHNVKMSHRIADYFVVSEGLKGDEKIVHEGVNQLRDGEIISIKAV